MITLVCVGKLDVHAQAIVNHYQKQMRDLRFQIVEVPHGSVSQEGERMMKYVNNPSYYPISLDTYGDAYDSIGFSNFIFQQSKDICFFIGGAEGLAPKIKKKVEKTISLGAMTWPHAFARVMLVEQIYRAEKIHRHHPYHK